MTEFRPSTSEDESQIIGLMARAFSVGLDAPFLNPALVRWKYWAVCQQWPEPRSWVGEQDGRIVDHACLWPVTLQTGEHGGTMIDWAADPQSSAPGVPLFRHLRRSYDFIYSAGGTPIAEALYPRLGFAVIGEVHTWARPLRPWRAIRDRSRNVPLRRIARNICSALAPPRIAPLGFSAVPISVLGGASLVEQPRPLCERDLSFIEFLAGCPISKCLAFHIRFKQRNVGWFALAIGRAQARIAGVWLEDPSADNWRTAFLLAQSAALDHTDASEILARCAGRESCLGAEKAGMKLYKRRPIYLWSANGSAQPLPIEYQLCDTDSAFLNIDHPGFETDSDSLR